MFGCLYVIIECRVLLGLHVFFTHRIHILREALQREIREELKKGRQKPHISLAHRGVELCGKPSNSNSNNKYTVAFYMQ